MKIGIIGAGNVGGTLAMRVLERGFGQVVLIDVLKGIAQGKALDLNEAGPVMNFEPLMIGTDDYSHLKGADIVVITAGLPRTPGMTREELFAKNLNIIDEIIRKIIQVSADAIIIVVTNPLDLMAYAAYKISGFPRERVIGMGGVLDGTRFAYFISERLNAPVKDIVPMVIGSHSDSMVVLPGHTTVSGKPLTELLDRGEIEKLIDRTKKGGAEIVNLLKSGSSFYASSAAAFRIIDSIINDTNDILPCSFFLKGEYGISGVSIGVPIRLGRDGVREVIELELNDEERSGLNKSVEALKGNIKDIDDKITNRSRG